MDGLHIKAIFNLMLLFERTLAQRKDWNQGGLQHSLEWLQAPAAAAGGDGAALWRNGGAQPESIVTQNVKDFRRVPELTVQAITPADFLTLLRS